MNLDTVELTAPPPPPPPLVQSSSLFGALTRSKNKKANKQQKQGGDLGAALGTLPSLNESMVLDSAAMNSGHTPLHSPVMEEPTKKKGLTKKVSKALHRLVSHDSNIYSTTAASVSRSQPGSLHSHLQQTPTSGGGSGDIISKQKLTKKFNASMRNFIAAINPTSLSPVTRTISSKKHQRLTSIHSQVSLHLSSPFGEDYNDYDSDNADNDDSSLDMERLNKKDKQQEDDKEEGQDKDDKISAALKRRQERRKKKHLDAQSSNNSSQDMSHASNSRLRRRQKHYERVQSSQRSRSLSPKPRARTRPRTARRSVPVLEEEEEGEDDSTPLIIDTESDHPANPGGNFLLSVLDEVRARKEATGELSAKIEQGDDENDADEEKEEDKKLKKKMVKKKKRPGKDDKKKQQKDNPRRKKKQPSSMPLSSDTDALSPEDEDDGDATLLASVAMSSDNKLAVEEPVEETESELEEPAVMECSIPLLTNIEDADLSSGACDEDGEEETPDAEPRAASIDPSCQQELEGEEADQDHEASETGGGSLFLRKAAVIDDDSILRELNEEDSVLPFLQKNKELTRSEANLLPFIQADEYEAQAETGIPFNQKNIEQMQAEVDQSLRNFSVRKRGAETVKEYRPATPHTGETVDPSQEGDAGKEKGVPGSRKTPEFRFSFSNCVVATSQDLPSPTSAKDDSVLSDVRAMDRLQKRESESSSLQRPSGLARRRSCPHLVEERELFDGLQKVFGDTKFSDKAFWEQLLNGSVLPSPPTPPPMKHISVPIKPTTRIPNLQEHLFEETNRGTTRAASSVASSHSRRGRSRSSRKRDTATNGVRTRRQTKVKSSKRASSEARERSKSSSQRHAKQQSDSRIDAARERSKSGSKRNGSTRKDGEAETRDRSTSKSQRSTRRISASEKYAEERERSRSPSLDISQLAPRERSKSSSRQAGTGASASHRQDRSRSTSKSNRVSRPSVDHHAELRPGHRSSKRTSDRLYYSESQMNKIKPTR
jgi:hypothetical protein